MAESSLTSTDLEGPAGSCPIWTPSGTEESRPVMSLGHLPLCSGALPWLLRRGTGARGRPGRETTLKSSGFLSPSGDGAHGLPSCASKPARPKGPGSAAHRHGLGCSRGLEGASSCGAEPQEGWGAVEHRGSRRGWWGGDVVAAEGRSGARPVAQAAPRLTSRWPRRL